MALSDALGIQALVQSYDEKAVNQALVSLATKINKSVDDVNKDLNKIKIDKDVVNNLVNQIKALPEEVRKKTQGMSFDLFSDLINADGAEEKIDEAMKTFSNKIQSFVRLRDQIGNDEIIIKADYSQIDELIKKTERLSELQNELNNWKRKESRPKTKINADISDIESQIKSGIMDLNVGTTQVGVGVNVDNEALVELDKRIKETEESLKSAREEAEKYGGSLKDLKDKIDEAYQISVENDTPKNARSFGKSVQDYLKAGGSLKDLSEQITSWYDSARDVYGKGFPALKNISSDAEQAQQDIKELEATLDDLYKQRDALTKNSETTSGKSDISGEFTGEIKGQNQLQSELDETKGKLQEVGAEAQEAKEKLEDLGKVDTNQEVNPKEIPTPSPTPEKEQQQESHSADSSDIQTYKDLQAAIAAVEKAIKSKTEEIQDEEVQMYSSVNGEIKKLEELKGKLNEIKSEFENGIASGLFKNTNNDTNNEEADGTSVNVDLKPTIDANKFKEDAERLLTFVDVEKEVNLKVGELDINNTADNSISKGTIFGEVTLSPKLSKTFKTEADELLDQINLDKEVNLKFGKLDNDYSDSTANDIIDNFNIKDKEIQDKIQTLVRSLSNISINEILSGTENSNFISVLDELGQVVVKNANIISDKIGIYDKFYEYFKNLGTIKISDTIKSNLGDDWNELRKAYPQKFSTKKGIELDSIYQEMSSQFKDIFSGVTDPSEQFREIINNIKLFRKDVAQSVSLTDDDINAVYQQLVSRVSEMRNQIKNDLGVSIDSNEFEQNKIKLEPLLDQPSWEKEIDRILGLIGTKKIKIEPDTTSQEWNDFKAYIEKISNLTINLKNVSGSNTSPQSDLNNSYTNSIKYATDLNKIEEQIAKAKESNNRQELEKLSTLEAQKKKFEELLKLEENFRENERFSGIDTSANDNELNQLRESFNQEYQKNRQTYASDLASNMDNLYDEAAGQYSKKLLQYQLNLQKEIESTKTRIVQLEKDSVMSDEDELSQNKAEQESLKQKLSLLEQSSNQIQNEINQFDQYIDKQKQAVALEEVRSKAEKDRAKLTKNSVDDSNNYARVNNLLKEQEETIRQINILQTKQDNTGLTDTEQSLLNSLSEKYLSIQERVTEELNKQYEVTSRIADRREKLATNNIGLDNIRSLDFSGDINFGNSETQINRITTAIDEANTEMQKLKSQGQTDLFANEFDKAAIKVQNLNNELLSNNITLSEYKSSIKELQSDLSKKTNAVEFFDPGNMEATMQQMKDIALQIPGIQEDTLKWGNANKTLTATLQDQNGEWKKVTISAQNAGNVITKTFTNVNAPAGTFSKFLDQLSSKFMNLGSYLVSFVGFYEVWDAIKQGVTYVKDLDTALTEMRKVSDETVDSLREFQVASFGVADSIGTTAKEIQNSTADFMRLGYSLQEAGELAQDANIYANVGDMEIDEATEHMISSIKAWGSEFESEVEASEAIIDRYNEIGM